MRILFLSNFFPPLSRGGYEEWCQEVALGLRRRGHDVTVLTSRASSPVQPADPSWVRRELFLEMEISSLRNSFEFFTRRLTRERENLAIVRRMLTVNPPDHVVIWGMWNMSRSIPALVEELLPGRTTYYMGDYWPSLPSQWRNYWQAKPRNWMTALPKLLLKPPAMQLLAREKQPKLQLNRVIFPTLFMQSELARLGFHPAQSPIVYGAIDTEPYGAAADRPAKRDDVLRLLYVGRLAPEKGVDLAIEAMGILAQQDPDGRRLLTIAGTGEAEYEQQLRELAGRRGVAEQIRFLGARPKDALPDLYRSADMLLFTSVWPEPFGRTPVEAMAAGLPVIGAPVGGAAEILADGETALHFTPGDAPDLAKQIARLAGDPELRERLTRNALQFALTRFDSERMTAEVESILQNAPVPETSRAAANAAAAPLSAVSPSPAR